MLSTATRNFVEEVDRGGLLVPVCSLNDTINLLTVVVKRKRKWVWQKPRYLPTDFSLNDILKGDPPIKPAVTETDFIKYNGTFGGNLQASVDASFEHSTVKIQGKESSKLQSSFGSLKKQEVDVPSLLRDTNDRMLDMSHCLIQQMKEKQRQVFGVVKERIVTTQPCSVIEDMQLGGQCGGGLTCGPKITKISLKENGSLNNDSNVTMEIPPHTTIAYGLVELEVKACGRFELCVMSGISGGFEVDGSAKEVGVSAVDAGVHASEDSCVTHELEQLNHHFQLLSDLPASTRSSLLCQLTMLMEEQGAISALQNVLERMCLSPSAAPVDVNVVSEKQRFKDFLNLVESAEPDLSVLGAVHLLTSALDEMTSDGLAVLAKCCRPSVLQILELLVQCAVGKGQKPVSSTVLTDHDSGMIEHLLVSSNMSLKRDGDTVKTEIHQQPGNLHLVCCIAVRGLSTLAQ
ncbi:gasdermin-E-like [Thalassophryne amazonica]|uniref:gasdermin-E-like n=1 Tax=Thalassophryne amazonica TaxID=390379 RepID=UPI0014720D23|nr:gasdermin-E-like [Thalassophryne amazonica]XP_034030881.1 gasdermin-E-like [Thalassophryne amazonica]